MADNLEIRVEQLTDAIRGLYNKPSLTPAEINNAFNTMLQRFENQTNLSSDKLVQIISNEIKRTVEERHGAIQEILFKFEDTIKSAATQMSNPKFEMQVSKISSDLNGIYTKMNNQELQLQKFSQSLEAMRTNGTAAEMVKLSNDFATFSRGFDSITSTLNSNFAEFLTQVQGFSQKDELVQIRYQLEEVVKSAQKITAAGDKIDALSGKMYNLSSKEDANYINEKITILTSFLSDLKAYMEKNDIENKEQFRNTISTIEQKLSALDFNTLNEIRTDIKSLFNEIRDTNTYAKDEIVSKFQGIVDIINKSYGDLGDKFAVETSNVNNNLAQLTGEIQKVYTTVTDGITGKTEELKMQIQGLSEDYQNLKNSLSDISSNSNIETAVNAILKSNSETIDLSHDFIQSRIQQIEDSLKQQEENSKQHLVNAIELLKTEFSQVTDRICSLEADMNGESIVKAFDEPIEKISNCVKSLQSAEALQEISALMSNVTLDITEAINKLKENIQQATEGTSVDVLRQLNEAVPQISDRLEVFRNHVVSENSANLTELKQHFSEVTDIITTRVEQITSSIKEEFNTVTSTNFDNVKVDLQNMSNHIMDSVENINENITREFSDHKTNIDEVLSRITDYEDKFRDKLNAIESTFETVTQESADRINDSVSLNQLQMQESLASLKEDILAGILGINKNNKTNFEIVDAKLEALSKKTQEQAQNKGVESLQESNQQELLAEIESKVERCNLQQIHNGKELLGEIQNLSSELSYKLENLNVQPANDIPPSFIRSLDDKVQSLLENSSSKEETIKLLKAHVDLRMREVIQKIAKIVSVFKPDTEKEEDAQKVAASVRLDELLSQLEYLKTNIFEEIRDGFDKLDKKEEAISDINKNVGEVLSNTVYLKNNVVSEIRASVEEKLEVLKNFEFLIEDIKSSLQNGQQNTLERINSLSEDLTGLIQNVQNTALDRINALNENVNSTHSMEERINQNTADRLNGLKEAICEELKNSISSKIDTTSINAIERIITNTNDTSDETNSKFETLLNQASERIASTVIDNIKGGIVNIETYLANIQQRKDGAKAIATGLNEELAQLVTDKVTEKVTAEISELLNQTKTSSSEGECSLSDLEADLAKLRFSVEKSNKNIGTDFQNIGGWMKNTSARLDNVSQFLGALSKKVENAQKMNMEEIKTRLIQSEKELNAPPKTDESFKEAIVGVQKKYKIQEMRLDELNEKISLLIQKQSEGFDVKSFIDLFYDNSTTTKSLVSRMDAIESKMNTISKNIEKIISYIDE